eukprot:TRINITY_DN30131_c0_g1_i1.p1 TRINITY_DN30131_c0_g1~~TRINITY_DN30131_c0_g1_i1.p1  ORF type:complete len:368 (+),score=89.51 TRINITY_DN30131_c0_g1_i1:56-1105(+)
MAADGEAAAAARTYTPSAAGFAGYAQMLISKSALPGSADATRVTLLYFAVAALMAVERDASGAFAAVWTPALRERIVAWLYSMQLSMGEGGGFAQTHSMRVAGDTAHLQGHVTATQCALLTLLMCGDDLSRVDRPAVAAMLARLQTPSGCFQCVSGGEADVRFVYSACVTAALLDLRGAFDTERTVRFVQSCEMYDGGFGGNPWCEGHGGTTFCAVASLVLLGAFDTINVARTRRWLMHRVLPCGFNGRPGKAADTCYTYWCGSTLQLLADQSGAPSDPLIDIAGVVKFVRACTTANGLVCKNEESGPDPLHSCLALLGVRNLGGVETCGPLDIRYGCLQSALAAALPA